MSVTYLVTVDDRDAEWMDERLNARNRFAPNGYSLFITSSVPALHMSRPITIERQDEACIHPGVFATDAPTTYCSRCDREIPQCQL